MSQALAGPVFDLYVGVSHGTVRILDRDVDRHQRLLMQFASQGQHLDQVGGREEMSHHFAGFARPRAWRRRPWP